MKAIRGIREGGEKRQFCETHGRVIVPEAEWLAPHPY